MPPEISGEDLSVADLLGAPSAASTGCICTRLELPAICLLHGDGLARQFSSSSSIHVTSLGSGQEVATCRARRMQTCFVCPGVEGDDQHLSSLAMAPLHWGDADRISGYAASSGVFVAASLRPLAPK